MPAKGLIRKPLTPASNFTTEKKNPAPHLELGMIQAGRAVMAEARRAEMPAFKPVSSPAASPVDMLERMKQAEQPLRATIKRAPSPAVTEGRGAPKHGTKAIGGKDLVTPRLPEKPRHAYLGKGTGFARTPAQVEINRGRKKNMTIARAIPTTTPILTAGISPADLANGAVSPSRGVIKMRTQPFEPGTPISIMEATPEAAAESLSRATPVLTLPITHVVAEPKNDPFASDPAGEGLGRFAFMAGAVFVAWLVFGRGA